jgi:hypothetical protein
MKVGYELNGAPVSESENRLTGMYDSIQLFYYGRYWAPPFSVFDSQDKEYPLVFGFNSPAPKMRIRDARGVLTYAGLVEFRDIPLLPLPPPTP